MLASDRSLWSGPVNVILDRWSHDNTKALALMLAQEKHHGINDKKTYYHTTQITMAIEQADESTHDHIQLLRNLFEIQQETQQRSSPLTDISIYVPVVMHMSLIENALIYYNGSSIENIILRDTNNTSTNDNVIEEDGNNSNHSNHANDHDDHAFDISPSIKQAVHQWLIKSKHALKNIEFPSFPLHCLPTSDLSRLESLTILAAKNLDAYQLRQDLPNLKYLTLHLQQAEHFSYVRPLLTNKGLYPWIESLTVICHDDLKLSLDQNELTESLMTIKGLSRVNAGWDMVAVDTL
ncbi:hypothetical protein INT45_006234 [Circinella minor]|uniref:Uncharacterized protein n=1 Tax=Circinella minor TaxID=1195481 RepID=A0A8H7RWK5_9FUNG|nr:hypothetical protein INT45_006234 [Circinella minor]